MGWRWWGENNRQLQRQSDFNFGCLYWVRFGFGFWCRVDGVMKIINRQGRGYGFEILRARILFNKLPMPTVPAFNLIGSVTDEEYKRIEEGFIRCLSCFKLHDSNVREVICDECWERLHPDDEFVKEILG